MQKMIDNVPSCLCYCTEYGYLPIHTAVDYKESVHYVPLLAKEGVKHKVGEDDARGGLLGVLRINVLTNLVSYSGDDGDGTVYLNAMKELRESNLPRR